jgi:hypothetical protein
MVPGFVAGGADMAWLGFVGVMLGCALLASGGMAAAEPAPSGSECRVALPDGGWTEAETWAWGEICAGRVADMKAHSADTLDCNPA